MNAQPIPMVVLLGPTATGKTRLGVSLAAHYNGEIISADSRQVYRGLNLGAGKDLQEYIFAGQEVPHHLIDVADLQEEYALFNFQRDAYAALEDIQARGRLPFLVGGTGLYLEAVLLGYDLRPVPVNLALRAELAPLPDEVLAERLRRSKGPLHNTTDTAERARLVRAVEIAEAGTAEPPLPGRLLNTLVLGIRVPREELRRHIRVRLLSRLQAGMLAEVKGLLDRGTPPERLRRLGLEYRFAADHLLGCLPDYAEFTERLFLAVCNFAKRQETWFRRMEKKGVSIHWLNPGNEAEAGELIKSWLAKENPLQAC
jgi:tRNA dimethylallyltransferase